MSKSRYFCGGSLVAAVLAMGLCAPAAAEEKGAVPAQVSEVVVTGSYIAGTPEDAALPVSVLSADTLQKQGSPSFPSGPRVRGRVRLFVRGPGGAAARVRQPEAVVVPAHVGRGQARRG